MRESCAVANKDAKIVGRNLKAAREKATPVKTQEEIGARVGLEQFQVQSAERGQSRPRAKQIIDGWHEEWGLSPEWFWQDHGEDPNPYEIIVDKQADAHYDFMGSGVYVDVFEPHNGEIVMNDRAEKKQSMPGNLLKNKGVTVVVPNSLNLPRFKAGRRVTFDSRSFYKDGCYVLVRNLRRDVSQPDGSTDKALEIRWFSTRAGKEFLTFRNQPDSAEPLTKDWEIVGMAVALTTVHAEGWETSEINREGLPYDGPPYDEK